MSDDNTNTEQDIKLKSGLFLTEEQEHKIYRVRQLMGFINNLVISLAPEGNNFVMDTESFSCFLSLVENNLPKTEDLKFIRIPE